ncbi:MAG: serine O-acetyltransferase, partial [Bradyrhizobium sp.]|nr:serine O-acetyltransferase [Bradyrhizobium sp.]
AVYDRDPATARFIDPLLYFKGFHALQTHRLAHWLHRKNRKDFAFYLQSRSSAVFQTDINPAARIGRGIFLDHATGFVCGETAIIGDHVRIYQAVTLGARHFPTEEDGTLIKGDARHPIVEDDVVIYAGATILGRITIGRGSTIGGNVWLTHDVPANSVVTQASLRNKVGGPALQKS